MNELLQRRDPPALGSERGDQCSFRCAISSALAGSEPAIQISMDQQNRVIIRRRGGHGFFLIFRKRSLGHLRSRAVLPLRCRERGALDYIVFAGQWAGSLGRYFPLIQKAPEGHCQRLSPSLCFCTCLDRISAGAAQHQYKHSAGDGEVLFQMQQLASTGEICVKTKSRLLDKISLVLPRLSVRAIPPQLRYRQ